MLKQMFSKSLARCDSSLEHSLPNNNNNPKKKKNGSKNLIPNQLMIPMHFNILLFRSLLTPEPELQSNISSAFKNLELVIGHAMSLTSGEPVAFFFFEVVHVELAQVGMNDAERSDATYAFKKNQFQQMRTIFTTKNYCKINFFSPCDVLLGKSSTSRSDTTMCDDQVLS